MKFKTKFGIVLGNYDNSEPNCCQYPECNEELNGLYNLWIMMGGSFMFDIWLCEKHFELWKKRFVIKKAMEKKHEQH
jgi:hypothetical protein